MYALNSAICISAFQLVESCTRLSWVMSSALPNPFQPVTYQAGGTAANSQSNTFPVSTIKMSYPAVVWYCWMFGKCCKPGLAYRRGEEQQVPFCCMERFSISLPGQMLQTRVHVSLLTSLGNLSFDGQLWGHGDLCLCLPGQRSPLSLAREKVLCLANSHDK